MQTNFDQLVCVNCHCAINDDVTLRIEPDILIHRSCLICHHCRESLADEDSCFLKFGRIFCYDHYRALFSKSCSICQNGFKTTDLVLPLCRDSYCHAHCLSCTVCCKLLTSGCKYTISNWSVVCSDCTVTTTLPSLSTISNSSFYSNKSRTPETSSDNIMTDSDNHFNTSSQRIHQSKGSDDEDEDLSDSDSSDYVSEPVTHSSTPKPDQLRRTKKPPRNRTVLSEKQLCTLQTYYQMNPKPDALMKEQLMEVTGLKQRVISVWFQNKRCKEKKRRLSDELHKNKSPGMLASAELLLTESPIEYDPQMSGIEIERVYNDSSRYQKDTAYIKNYFTTMLSEHKFDQSSSSNRCTAPLVRSLASHNQYSNAARLH